MLFLSLFSWPSIHSPSDSMYQLLRHKNIVRRLTSRNEASLSRPNKINKQWSQTIHQDLSSQFIGEATVHKLIGRKCFTYSGLSTFGIRTSKVSFQPLGGEAFSKAESTKKEGHPVPRSTPSSSSQNHPTLVNGLGRGNGIVEQGALRGPMVDHRYIWCTRVEAHQGKIEAP